MGNPDEFMVFTEELELELFYLCVPCNSSDQMLVFMEGHTCGVISSLGDPLE